MRLTSWHLPSTLPPAEDQPHQVPDPPKTSARRPDANIRSLHDRLPSHENKRACATIEYSNPTASTRRSASASKPTALAAAKHPRLLRGHSSANHFHRTGGGVCVTERNGQTKSRERTSAPIPWRRGTTQTVPTTRRQRRNGATAQRRNGDLAPQTALRTRKTLPRDRGKDL